MKKNLVPALLLAASLTLAACGEEKTPAPAPAEVPVTVSSPAPAEAPPESAPVPAEEPAADAFADTIALVQSLKDHDVSELYEAVGEPESSEYGSSCLVQGGQDGQLFYEGFTVYTLVQPDGTETVYDVE